MELAPALALPHRGVRVGPALRRSLQHRDLGWVPDGRTVVGQPGVVARRDCVREALERLRRRPDGRDAHAVLGQSAGLVGADDVRRPERLDGAETFHHGALAHQLAHAHGQRESDHRQQPLRHVADQETDGKDHGIGQRQAGAEHGERDERDTGRHCDQRDQPCHTPNLSLQRTLVSLNP